MKIGERFLLLRQFCHAFFERNPYFFFICFFFWAVVFFASAFARCIYGTAGEILKHFGVTNGRTVGARYTAPKLSAISYLFGTFSLLIMGNTERLRYTGFRGLSVRGITALQCIFLTSG